MSRGYFTYEEEEAHKQGHEDQRYNRTDYDHDKYSDNAVDIAYWDGKKEEQRIQEREAEERDLERLQEELAAEAFFEEQQRIEAEIQDFELRQLCAQEEYLYEEPNPDLQIVNDFDALMEREMNDAQSQDAEIGITEEELFNDILNDERLE